MPTEKKKCLLFKDMDPYHKELGRNVPKNSHEGNKGLGMISPVPW